MVVMSIVLVFVIVSLMFVKMPRISYKMLILVTVSVCAIEVVSGMLQLLGIRDSNNSMYALTGTFQNPGPYGGFLSVCISIIVAFCIRNRELYKKVNSHCGLMWFIAGVAMLAFSLLISTQSRAAMLSLVCSLSFIMTGCYEIRLKLKHQFKEYRIIIFLMAVIMAIGAYLYKKPSADGRLFMNRISLKAICSNGIIKGAGLNRFGGSYGEAQADYFERQIAENGRDDLDWSAINEHERMTADCPDKAFNEYLHIGVEAGPLAMLAFIGCLVCAIVISYRNGTIWSYGLTAMAVFAFFSYPFHIDVFRIMLAVLLAASFSKETIEKDTQKPVMRTAMLSLLLIALTVAKLAKLPEIRQVKSAESCWRDTEFWYKMGFYNYVVNSCDSLFRYKCQDYRFLYAYGQSLNKTGNYLKSDSILELGSRLSSDPMFWNVMGNNSLSMGLYREAERRYKHAFYMVPNRMYPLYLLAKLYYEEKDSVRFFDMADRIESFKPKIESVKTELLRSEIKELKTLYYEKADIRK